MAITLCANLECANLFDTQSGQKCCSEECKKAYDKWYHREYYSSNKEQIDEYKRQDRRDYPEKYREQEAKRVRDPEVKKQYAAANWQRTKERKRPLRAEHRRKPEVIAARRRYMEKYKEGNAERMADYFKWYRETHRKQTTTRSARHHQLNKTERRVRKRARYVKWKIKILTHYGNGQLKCLRCPETRLGALTIDHTAGFHPISGKQHRREIKARDATTFYYWLHRQGYPDGYGTLCFNCNFKAWLYDPARLATLSQSPRDLKRRAAHVQLKALLIDALGDKCKCCSCTDIDVLTMDHIGNDGSDHRRKLGVGSGTAFIAAVVAAGDYSMLQCLCRNCNCLKEYELKRFRVVESDASGGTPGTK